MQTLYDSFITVFGEYTPIIGTDPVSGASIDCVNYGYIASCLMAIVCLYGVLRILGTMFSNRH